MRIQSSEYVRYNANDEEGVGGSVSFTLPKNLDVSGSRIPRTYCRREIRVNEGRREETQKQKVGMEERKWARCARGGESKKVENARPLLFTI